MKVLFEVKDPFREIHQIAIFEPSRGTGGTLAFPVRINEKQKVFEMNEDCIWQSQEMPDKLEGYLTQYIHELIEYNVYNIWINTR